MKFIDYNSPEKDIINDTFKSLPYMDMWISSIVEGYIYEKTTIIDYYGYRRREYTLRYNKLCETKAWYRGEDGQLYSQEYYKEGKREGECKWWHPNGQLKHQYYYKNEKLDGEIKDWYSNGQLELQCYYKEGKREGEYKEWKENGQIMFQKYYKNGKLDGEIKRWYENGKLKRQKYYKNGNLR
jgi:antitoxin component YwqK of YwqJK toxin-antitoxin module